MRVYEIKVVTSHPLIVYFTDAEQMQRLILSIYMLLCSALTLVAQNITGRVVDSESGEPIA